MDRAFADRGLRAGMRLLIVGAVTAVAAGAAIGLDTGTAAGQAGYSDLFFPLSYADFAGSFPAVPTVRPPAQTPVPPTGTAGPTATRTLVPTQGAPATPTLPGNEVRHPTSPDAIVMQIGWTETDQPGQVWEEMNGTPWLTLYGDGRIIAGRQLLDRKQELFIGQTSEYQIQLWLRYLTYDLYFFQMRETYEHRRGSKPVVHVYVATTGGASRVEIRGFKNWERYEEPSEPDRQRVVGLVEFVRDMEEYLAANLEEPYSPEWYTILAQRTHPPLLPDAPKWPHSLNIRAIATMAPTAASNYVDKVVGHKFVKAKLGKEIHDTVVPFADQWWPFYTRAAEFSFAGRSYAVGARQEVPGGSPFLPPYLKAFWYRSDPGSGRPLYPLEAPLQRSLADLARRLVFGNPWRTAESVTPAGTESTAATAR